MNISEMKQRLKKGEDPLELSIEKWQDVVDGTGSCMGEVNCALCEQFNRWVGDTRNCKKCPVFRKTGELYCEGSPYQKYAELEFKHGVEKELHELAKQELAFLISLRPLWANMKVDSLHSTKKEVS